MNDPVAAKFLRFMISSDFSGPVLVGPVHGREPIERSQQVPALLLGVAGLTQLVATGVGQGVDPVANRGVGMVPEPRGGLHDVRVRVVGDPAGVVRHDVTSDHSLAEEMHGRTRRVEFGKDVRKSDHGPDLKVSERPLGGLARAWRALTTRSRPSSLCWSGSELRTVLVSGGGMARLSRRRDHRSRAGAPRWHIVVLVLLLLGSTTVLEVVVAGGTNVSATPLPQTLEAWIYPASAGPPACDVRGELASLDGQPIAVLKPEYLAVTNGGRVVIEKRRRACPAMDSALRTWQQYAPPPIGSM